ncbi:E3 ubiquitin-protein ligase TRIM21-like [Emydura macquarii macquarii]|uniref:E3 ubiquitin-protein ligase TRIM21-like n=1 Tax=Emydura macquarii macquarii TaxID=1129001 RepID=UPI00352A69CB
MAAPAAPGSGKRKAEEGLDPPASTSLVRSELDDAICDICKEYLTDPVTIECEHNFCRACITRRWEGEETPFCPQCGKQFQKRDFTSNKQLGRLVQTIKQVGLNPGKRRRAAGNVCAEHGKELAWFCKKDNTFICVDCKGSPAYRSHAVIPMGKAAHQSKEEANTSSRSEDGNAQDQEAISTERQELKDLASAHPLRKLLEEVVCHICTDYCNDPVSIDCGHNFCRVCITAHYEKWEKDPGGVCCPQCREKMKKEKFQTNGQLASMVENIQQVGKKLEILKQQTVCTEHEDKEKRFCEDDGEVICPVCDKTQKHKSHGLVPVEEAAQKYKEKLQKDIELLKKAKGKISELESKERNKPNDWKESVKHHSQRISSEFETLELLLSEEKKLFPQRLEEEERETLKKVNENITKLSQQSSLFQQLMAEIEKKCQQPAAELLKDVKDTLARSEQVRLQEPELIAAELKGVYRVPGLMEMLRQFTVDVTLDPDTAHPKLVLSEDGKRVRYGDTRQDLPDNPERFDNYPIVLGAEGFLGGKRYWEVEVGDKTDWALGVCRESVKKKGQGSLSPQDGYWAMWLRDEEYEACTTSRTLLQVSVRPSRVGIFLDYEAGEVSFYNVTDRSQLFTFTDTFSGTLHPYFYPGLSAGGENAAPLIICPVPAQAGGNLCP